MPKTATEWVPQVSLLRPGFAGCPLPFTQPTPPATPPHSPPAANKYSPGKPPPHSPRSPAETATSPPAPAATVKLLPPQPHHTLIHRILRHRGRGQHLRHIILPNHANLHRPRHRPPQRQPITRRIQPKVFDDTRKRLQRLLRPILIHPLARQRASRNNTAAATAFPAGVGESCKGFRRALNAPIASASHLRIEEPSTDSIIKPRQHRIRNLLRRAVVRKLPRSLPRIQRTPPPQTHNPPALQESAPPQHPRHTPPHAPSRPSHPTPPPPPDPATSAQTPPAPLNPSALPAARYAEMHIPFHPV